MTWEWKIGDPVDDATGGSMDAMNWGHGGGDDERSDYHDSRVDEYSKKAWDFYMNYDEVEALRYINRALDLDRNHAGNWNRKAIILEGMKRYAESEICYGRSLELSSKNLVYDNKARMLFSWAGHLLEESKKQPNGLRMLGDALEKVIKAINALPGEGSEENLDKYLRLKDSIKFYIGYENEFQRKCEILYQYDKSELFTITATRFFKNGKGFREGMPLELIREPDNEFDRIRSGWSNIQRIISEAIE